MLASVISLNVAIASLIGVLLLITLMNARSILADRSLEITTSAALIVNYLLGVLVGLSHIFTPVAGAIVMTMLLAWKTELSRFAGSLQPAEIRSAVLLGLIGFVIYPVLPNRYVDPWQLFNTSDAWISVIAIAGIGFVNYVFPGSTARVGSIWERYSEAWSIAVRLSPSSLPGHRRPAWSLVPPRYAC
jgi:uncharacterized membrane protein (DUF4010 family)